MGNAVLDCRPQRRAAGPLFAQHDIWRFSRAILPFALGFSSGYRKHPACRSPKQAEAANHRGCPPAKISIAHPFLPAVSFLGGFQTPAGPKKTCAHPSGRHLKPITFGGQAGVTQRCRAFGWIGAVTHEKYSLLLLD